MAATSREMRGQTKCTVNVSPGVVDAGADMTLQARVSCSPACDLRGHTLLLKDQAGADAGSLEFSEFDGETNETAEFVVKAPLQVGEHNWMAVCPPVARQGVSYGEASTPIPFAVKPHSTSVLAWDVPSAVVMGERFRMKVGIKCSSECRLTNKEFAVFDHNGATAASGRLGSERWPGTAALYVAEFELKAPPEEGLYTCSVECAESGDEPAHAAGSIRFGVRVVRQPECLVTVETLDKETQTPLRGARVVIPPYHGVTDDRGIAQVRVAKGAYRLFVSQAKYVTLGLPVELAADMTARAELDLEPPPEGN